MSKELQLSRKNFLSKLGMGVAGVALLTSLPSLITAKTRKRISKIKISVHPNAVKRNK